MSTPAGSPGGSPGDPVAAPPPPAPPPPPYVPPTEPYRPLEGKAQALRVLIYITIAVSAILMVSSFLYWRALDKYIKWVAGDVDGPDPFDSIAGPEAVSTLSSFLWFGFVIAGFIVFLVWFRAAYRNLRHFRQEQRMKQGWAVWSWFVPIVLLWFPKKLANDISRATTRWNHGSKLRPTPLRWWWGLYLASLLVSRLDTTSISDVSNEGLRETAGVTALNAAVLIAFLFVNLWFINNVTKEMSRRQAADPAFTGTAETGIGGEVPRDHTN